MGIKVMTLQDKQKASLDALLFLDKYCNEHGIRYFLAYGTLLGAVRHQGFIPWDDDIDVHIPRPDYDRLLNAFEDPDGNYKLVSCFTDSDYILPFAKIQNMNTARVIRGKELSSQGIGIDLFPLDGIPDDLEAAEKIFVRHNKSWLQKTDRLERFRRIEPHTILDYAKGFCGRIAYLCGYLSWSVKKLSCSPFAVTYDEAQMVGTVIGIHSGKFRPFEKKWFEPYSLNFEGHKLFAPRGYRKILTMVYGDYMRFPPVDMQITTHTDTFVWK